MSDIEKKAEIALCPFCGDWGAEVAESAVPSIHGGQKQAVYCNTCFCEGPTSETEEGAVEAWNRRAATVEAVKTDLLTGGAVNLLDQQHSGVVTAQVLDVVPAAALGTDEAGAVGIGGQADHFVGVELAEVASEHGPGITLGCDRSVNFPEGHVQVPMGRVMRALAIGWRRHAAEGAKGRAVLIQCAEAVEAALVAASPKVSP